MNPPKPIKRNPAIVELSKDHHFALLLIWKIREGIKNSVEVERIRRYVIHFCESDLLPHFKDEEELLFIHLPVKDKLRLRAEKEHTELRSMMDNVKTKETDKDSLLSFATALENHIRFEERELFNYLQESIPEKELSSIASALNKRQHEPSSLWTDAFWLKKKEKN